MKFKSKPAIALVLALAMALNISTTAFAYMENEDSATSAWNTAGNTTASPWNSTYSNTDTPGNQNHATSGASTTSLTGGTVAGITIALDPGHGGTAGGATYGGIKESDINFKIASYLKEYLETYPGVTVYMTRTDNTQNPGLEERVTGAVEAGADVFISLHNDAAPNKDANGSTVYYANDSWRPIHHEEGANLSQHILDELVGIGLKDNGIKIHNSESGSTYADGQISDYYGIIRHGKEQNITAIIVEHAYLSNTTDRETYLTTDDSLQNLAFADGRGIAAYFGLVGSTTEGVIASTKGYASAALINLTAVPGGATYDIYRSDMPTEGFTLIDSVHYTPTDYTEVPVYDEWGYFKYNEYIGLTPYEYLDENLDMDSRYYYQVIATTADGGVSRSNTVSVSTAVKLNSEVCSAATGKMEISWRAQRGVRGYYIYRSTSKKGNYERVAKILGEDEDLYIDENLELNKYYYYYVTAFVRKNGKIIESSPSEIKRNYTIAAPEITSVKEGASENITLTWSAVEGAQYYDIYRKKTTDKEFENIKEISADKLTYKDTDTESGVTYEYRVLAVVYLRSTTGISDYSDAVKVTAVTKPVLKNTRFNKRGQTIVKWYKSTGASGYEIQRADGDGEFVTIKTVNGATTKKFKDKTTIIGGTYTYRIRALNNDGIVRGATDYVEYDEETIIYEPTIETAEIDTTKTGIKVTWSGNNAVTGYIIYRRDTASENTKYKKLKKITGADKLSYTDTSSMEPGQIFAYAVESFVETEQFGLVRSAKTEEIIITAGYSIMGETKTTVEQMVSFYINKEKPYPADVYSDYGAPTIEDFATIVYEEAIAEGVRAEVVFAQMCKETGFLQYGGDVSPEQCNFAGIGATGGVPGNSFTDVREGVRAQVQHLKAYASDEDLVNECVDPRFYYVTRLQSIYVEWLGRQENPNGGGWAAALGYGYSLRDDYIIPLLNT